MEQASADSLARLLATASGVAPDYRHIAKQVVPGVPLVLPAAVLKWYELHPAAQAVPAEIAALARAPIASAALPAGGFGFVMLHRCGNDFYFLIVCTWRNENELWETVWYKDGDKMSAFAPFPRPAPHLPTFCVWELVPVWHEQQAWTRFLLSERNDTAAQRWLCDRYSGVA